MIKAINLENKEMSQLYEKMIQNLKLLSNDSKCILRLVSQSLKQKEELKEKELEDMNYEDSILFMNIFISEIIEQRSLYYKTIIKEIEDDSEIIENILDNIESMIDLAIPSLPDDVKYFKQAFLEKRKELIVKYSYMFV